MVAARPTYVASAAFTSADARAASLILRATQAADEPDRGRLGQLALDQVNVANDLLLSEFGPADARTRLQTSPPWFGTTLDTTTNHDARLDLAARPRLRSAGSASSSTATGRRRTTPPWCAPRRPAGLKIMGEPVDSYYAKHYTRRQYLRQVQACVNAFPQIDAWEVGNEVNGSWLGPASTARSPMRRRGCSGTRAPRWSSRCTGRSGPIRRRPPCSTGCARTCRRRRAATSTWCSCPPTWRTRRWVWHSMRSCGPCTPSSPISGSGWASWTTGRPTPRAPGGPSIGATPPGRGATRWPRSITRRRWATPMRWAAASGGISPKRDRPTHSSGPRSTASFGTS